MPFQYNTVKYNLPSVFNSTRILNCTEKSASPLKYIFVFGLYSDGSCTDAVLKPFPLAVIKPDVRSHITLNAFWFGIYATSILKLAPARSIE